MGPDYRGMTDTDSGTREVTIYTGNAAATYPLSLSNSTTGNSTTFNLDLTAYQALEDLSARLAGSRANGADRS